MSPNGTLSAGARTTARSIRRTHVVASPLLASGILSSLAYIATDQLCAARYPGYRQLDQAISELSAVGAPTARLWSALMPVFSILLFIFGVAVMRAGRENRALRRSGIMMLVFILSGPLWAIVPMHQRGAATNWQDTGHLVMGGLSLALMLAVIFSGASAFGRRFRAFSVATGLVVLAAGITTFTFVPRVVALEPTPWLGLIERVMLYGFMLWIATLTSAMLREGA